MDAAWAVVAAGLGGSLVTGAFSLGVVQLQARHQRADAKRRERREAYSQLLTYTGLLAHEAQTLHLTMKFRSGIGEGLDVLTGSRKPLDPLALHAQMRDNLVPIYRAWSAVWTVGTQEAINAANQLISQAASVVSAATKRGEARGNLMRTFAGEKWTPEQLDNWHDQEERLAHSRRAFSAVARAELGSEVAEVFESVPEPRD